MDNSKEASTSGSVNRRMHNENENVRKQAVSRQRIVQDDRDDINQLADAFIKNFRNQLKIQREESLKRFQEMLARGVWQRYLFVCRFCIVPVSNGYKYSFLWQGNKTSLSNLLFQLHQIPDTTKIATW